MNKSHKYYPVNWEDGMKINKNNFIDQDNAFMNQLRNRAAAQVNRNSYGLLPLVSKEENPFKIWVDVESHQLILVKIEQCKAITTGGFFIDISEKSGDPIVFSLDYADRMNEIRSGNAAYYICLSVNPFKRIPTGVIDPEEEPPRYPYVVPEYKVVMLPVEEVINNLPNPHYLIIAKVLSSNNTLQINNQYIPPCTSVHSHPALAESQTNAYGSLIKLESASLLIIQKVLQKDHQFILAQLVKFIAENVLMYLNTQMFHFRSFIPYSPPLQMISSLAGLGRTIKNSIDMHQGTGKEELLNYFVEWCDMSQSELEGSIYEVVNLEYRHSEIYESLEKCTRFLNTILNLFQKMSELDYIGRKTEKTILVKEESVKDAPKSRIKFFER
jgi:hypothetical protein